MTVSRDFRTFFWLKRFNLDPIGTGENGFMNFFVFAKTFDCKVRKLRVRESATMWTCKFFIRYRRFHIIKLLILGL